MITDKLVIDAINTSLNAEWRVLDGRPIYRIVFADDQIERRKGKFSDFYGEIFIREYQAVRDVKKYWYYPRKDVWVLEKLVFMPRQSDMAELLEELVHAQNGTYEPIYTFMDIKGNPLPVVHEVVDFIIHRLHNPTAPLSRKDFETMEKQEEKAEVDYFEQELRDGERSPLFVYENSAFVSTEQLKFRKQMTYDEATPVQNVDLTI